MLEINIGSIRVASCRPYVYIGFSRAENIAYVGQTLDRRGFMGRWTDHLSGNEKSSFSSRLAEYDEGAFDRINDLHILAWDLGSHQSFVTLETAYREAVEYLVQKQFWTFCGDIDPWLRPISTVRASPAVTQDFVRKRSDEIVTEFREYYEELR